MLHPGTRRKGRKELKKIATKRRQVIPKLSLRITQTQTETEIRIALHLVRYSLQVG